MPSNGNGRVTLRVPRGFENRLVWDGKKWVDGDTPKGFPILNKRDKFTAFAWTAIFVVDAALIIVTAYRIYRLLVKEWSISGD